MAKGNPEQPERRSDKIGRRNPDILRGTTLRVYRFMYREGRTLGVYEVQRGLGLASPSVAHYHIRKLVEAELVQEREGGYLVDKVLFENMIRIRRSLIPLQTTFAMFFGTTLVGLLTVLRPGSLSAIYAFALIINCVALGIFVYQTFDTLRRSRI